MPLFWDYMLPHHLQTLLTSKLGRAQYVFGAPSDCSQRGDYDTLFGNLLAVIGLGATFRLSPKVGQVRCTILLSNFIEKMGLCHAHVPYQN